MPATSAPTDMPQGMPLNAAPGPVTNASVCPEEIARFSALAQQWWDPTGPMRPLHAMNTVRTEWISRHLPLRGRTSRRVRLLDIGCGAGLASESLATAGHDVLGLDARQMESPLPAPILRRTLSLLVQARSPTAMAVRKIWWLKGNALMPLSRWKSLSM